MATILNIMHTDAPDDMANRKLLIRDTLVEFVSTSIFVYFGTLSVVSTGTLLVESGIPDDAAKLTPISFAFGVAIAVLVYSMGHLTGGHMNPGVTLLMYFRRMISLKRMLSLLLAGSICRRHVRFSHAMGNILVIWTRSRAGEHRLEPRPECRKRILCR